MIKNNLIDYDDIILPVVFKKLNPNLSQSNLEENGIAEKGELEELSPLLFEKYNMPNPFKESTVKEVSERLKKELESKRLIKEK